MKLIVMQLRYIVIYLASLAIFTPLLAAQTLYQRDVSMEEEQRYFSTYWDEYLAENKSEDELRKEILANDWSQDWYITKVELLQDEDTGEFFMRVNSLGRDKRRETREAQWVTSAAQRLLIGDERLKMHVEGNLLSFNSNQRDLGFNDDPLSIYLPSEQFIGRAFENFRSSSGFNASATIFEAFDSDLIVEEFLRLLMPFKLEVTQSEFGPVIRFSDTYPVASTANQNASSRLSGAAWISGNNLAVYITAMGADPMDMAAHYGKKYPSSLSPSLKIDKNKLALNELQLGIKRLDAAINNPPGPVDWYVFHLSRLIDHVYFPFPTLEVAYTSGAQGRLQLSRSIKVWSSENITNFHWDDVRGMLVAQE